MVRAFDVAFIDRPHDGIKCGGPSWALQTILQDMQKQGEILVIPEGTLHAHHTPQPMKLDLVPFLECIEQALPCPRSTASPTSSVFPALDKAVVGWKMWVTYRRLDAESAHQVCVAESKRQRPPRHRLRALPPAISGCRGDEGEVHHHAKASRPLPHPRFQSSPTAASAANTHVSAAASCHARQSVFVAAKRARPQPGA